MAEVIAAEDTGPVALTLDTAKTKVEGLLSALEKGDAREKTPLKPKVKAAAEDANSSEPEETEEESDSEEVADATERADDEETTEESETEEEEADDTPAPKKFTVKVDGKDEEVDEDELKAGYSRTKTFTQKSQALAAERKKFEQEEVAAVRAERQKYSESLGTIEEAVKALVGAEPDWAALRQSLTPAEFAAQRADWDINKDRLDGIKREKDRVTALSNAENEKAMREYVLSEHTQLLDALPAWKNPEVAKKDKIALRDFAVSRGFTEDALNSVADHKIILLLNDARLYHEGKSKAAAVQDKIKKAADATKSTASATRKPTSEQTKALQRLAKTGRMEDATAAIALRLG